MLPQLRGWVYGGVCHVPVVHPVRVLSQGPRARPVNLCGGAWAGASNLLGGRHRIGTTFFLLPGRSSALHFLRGLRFHWPRSSWAAVHRSPTTLLKPSGKRREQPSVADLILSTLNFCKMGLIGDLLKVMASAQSKNRSR